MAEYITVEEKLACIERELSYRHRVYGRLVEAGKMSEKQQQYELDVMEAIAEDYRKAAAMERLL